LIVPCNVALAPGTDQSRAPLILREAILKLKWMPVLCAKYAPPRPPRGGDVDAGTAAYHYPAGNDPDRSAGNHAHPPHCQRRHGPRISKSCMTVSLQPLHCADLLIDAQNCAGPRPLERHAMGVGGIRAPLPLWLALSIGAVAPRSFSGWCTLGQSSMASYGLGAASLLPKRRLAPVLAEICRHHASGS
jgi:hypothetical protein